MHQLLINMPLERLEQIYAALPEPVLRALDTPIAQALHSRPMSVARRPLRLRVKALRAFLVTKRDEGLAGDVLRAYLLGPRKQLVADFLDATGVPHEDGQIEDEEDGTEATPEEEKVPGAVAALLKAHEREDVTLYLQIARLQWPDSGALAAALEPLREAD